MDTKKGMVNFLKNYNLSQYNYFCNLRRIDSVSACKRFFDASQKNPYVREKIKEMYFPSSLNMLRRRLEYNPQTSLKEIIKWDEIIIKHFANELNQYLKLKHQYEKFFFEEEYLQAWEVLCDIEKECGCSLWLIEQQFGVLYCTKAEDEVEKLLFFYKEQTDSSLIKYILSFLKWRKNMTMNCEEYMDYVEKLLQNYEKTSNTAMYLTNKFSIYRERSQDIYKLELQIDEAFSAIDLYELFIDVMFFLLHENKTLISEDILWKMRNLFNDNRWDSMVAYRSPEVPLFLKSEEGKLIYQLLEQYSACNWHEAEQMLELYLSKNSDDFMMHYLYVKCLLFQNKSLPNMLSIFDSLYRLYIMTDNQISIKVKFDYLLKKYYGTSWQYKVQSIIERKIEGIEDGFMDFMSICNDKHITPLFCKILCQDDRYKFLSGMKAVCPKMSKILSIQYGVCNEPLSIDNVVKGNYITICNLSLNVDYRALVETGKKALKFLDSKEISCNHAAYYYYKERICRQLFPALLNLGYLKDAIDLYGQMYLERKMLVKRLDVKRIVNMMEKLCSDYDKDISFMSTIYAPIIYHCLYGNRYPEKVIIGYRNFLFMNHVDNLFDWMKRIVNISQAEIYFLFQVCTEEILARDYKTLGKNETETETDIRVYILWFLVEKDYENSKRYMEELNTIFSRQKLDESVQSLNRNRIHIEVDKLYIEMEEFLKREFEQYNLYQKLKGEVDVAINEDIDGEIRRNSQHLIKQEVIQYQSENAFYLFLIEQIVANYLMNRRYGLNTYLGTRIRHNYCQQYLFSVFEKWNLLSKKEKDDSTEYIVNECWNKIGNEVENCNIIEVLNVFSRNMNDKLQIIKNEWIQIKNEDKKDGLFDYDNISEKILNYTLIVKNSYEIVFYTTVEEMNKKTVNLLTAIRQKLGDELKCFFELELNRLRENLRKIELSDDIITKIFFDIQKCEEELPNTIENFQNIFYFDNISYPDFTMQKVIDCNLAIFQKLYPDIKKQILLSYIQEEKLIKGSFFPDWIDIIGIIFQNAKEHSNYRSFENANFKINIWYDKIDEFERMFIMTSNKVNETLDKLKEMDLKIGNCIRNIHQDRFLEESIREEGSGLYKIARIIKYNFNVAANYEAGLSEKKFVFKIDLPVGSMERK